MRKAFIFAVALLASSALCNADAESRDGNSTANTGSPWSGDIRQFATRDFPRWRSGRWIQALHDGRGGWWWVVADTWYPYEQVSYPYPDPYTPNSYHQPRTIEPNPAAHTIEPTPPLIWYFCESSGHFYPYTIHCDEGWMEVPVGLRPQPRTRTRTKPSRPPIELRWTTARRDRHSDAQPVSAPSK